MAKPSFIPALFQVGREVAWNPPPVGKGPLQVKESLLATTDDPLLSHGTGWRLSNAGLEPRPSLDLVPAEGCTIEVGDVAEEVSSMRVRAHGWTEVARAICGDHFWSPSYAVVSCGGAPLEIVKAYVENQHSPRGQLVVHVVASSSTPPLGKGVVLPLAHYPNDDPAVNALDSAPPTHPV